MGVGQVLNGFDRRTGERNRCYAYDTEDHSPPKCPKWPWGPHIAATSPSVNKAPLPYRSSISTENSVSVRIEAYRNPNEGGGNCEHSLSTTPKAGGQLVRVKEGSVDILETVATANLARFRLPANCN